VNERESGIFCLIFVEPSEHSTFGQRYWQLFLRSAVTKLLQAFPLGRMLSTSAFVGWSICLRFAVDIRKNHHWKPLSLSFSHVSPPNSLPSYEVFPPTLSACEGKKHDRGSRVIDCPKFSLSEYGERRTRCLESCRQRLRAASP